MAFGNLDGLSAFATTFSTTDMFIVHHTLKSICSHKMLPFVQYGCLELCYHDMQVKQTENFPLANTSRNLLCDHYF